MRSRPFLSQVTYVYLAALSLVVLVVLGSFGVSQIGRAEQREHLALLSLSSRQPVLVERAALLAVLLTEAGTSETRELARDQLRATGDELVLNHQRLQAAGLRLPWWVSAGVPFAAGQPLTPPEVETLLRPFLAHLTALAAASDAQLTLSQADRVALLAASEPLAARLTVVERWYKLVTRVDRSALASLQTLTLIVVLGLLACEALVILRPLLRRLSDEQAERAMLSLVASHTDNGVIITDAQGRVVWLNDGLTRITGYSLADLMGHMPGGILQGPATDPATALAIRDAVKAGKTITTEVASYHKDGHPYWLMLTITPVRDSQGKIERYIAVVGADITARKALESSLRASLKDLAEVRFVLDQAANVTITDKNGAILEASDIFCRIFGYSRSELIGQTHRLVNSGYHGHAHWSEFWDMISRGQVWRGEILNRAKDGRLYWMYSTVVPLLDEAGKPIRYLAVRFDISERKRAEEALRASEATNRALLDALPDLMFRLRGDGLILSYRTPRNSDLALPLEALIGRRIDEVVPVGLAGTLMKTLRATIETGNLQLVEYTVPVGESVRDYEARMTPSGGDEVLAIVRDISERKASERLKREFVAMVSHELRTPLTAIRGSLGLISGGVAGTVSAQAQTMIGIAYKNSERLVRLINDILDIEKIESGQMSFHRQPIDLGQLLAQTIEANSAYGAQFGVSFVLEPPPKIQIFADADRIVQVFTNLLSNAAKFSPQGEVVTVWVRRHAGLVRVGVSDCGPGIPESFRERIFQKFAQADSSSTREKGGTGLGLSIARAIVEHHGGRISFATELDAGTTFVVELPEWHPVIERAAAPPAGRILVCEDDPDVAHLLKLVLQRAGFVVEVVYTADDLRVRLSDGCYDVITLDIQLQHQDGVALIRELRAHEVTAGLPIIVVSGLVDRAREDLGGDAMGRIEWLPKPIDSATLVAAVTRAVRRAPSASPRILHVDSDPDIVQVVMSLVGATAVVTHAETVADAQARLAETHYDLALLDLVLPDGSGLEVLSMLQAGRPPTPAVIFSAHELDSALGGQVAASLVKSRVTNRELCDTITRLLAAPGPGPIHDALPAVSM